MPNKKFYCRECGPERQWDTLEDMLREHPTLKDYPNLHGVIIDGKELR